MLEQDLTFIETHIEEKIKLFSKLARNRKQSSTFEPTTNQYPIFDKWKTISINALLINIVIFIYSFRFDVTAKKSKKEKIMFLKELENKIITTIKGMNNENPYINEFKSINKIIETFKKCFTSNQADLKIWLKELIDTQTTCLVEIEHYNEIIKNNLITTWKKQLHKLKKTGNNTQHVKDKLQTLQEKFQLLTKITSNIPDMIDKTSGEIILKDIYTQIFLDVQKQMEIDKTLYTGNLTESSNDGQPVNFLNKLGTFLINKFFNNKKETDKILQNIVTVINENPDIEEGETEQNEFNLPHFKVKSVEINLGTIKTTSFRITKKTAKLTTNPEAEDTIQRYSIQELKNFISDSLLSLMKTQVNPVTDQSLELQAICSDHEQTTIQQKGNPLKELIPYNRSWSNKNVLISAP